MENTSQNRLAPSLQSSWTKPLNWNLHMSVAGEERVPFYFYVQPGTTQNFPFPQFTRLPTELQFRILAFCSASTLFQIMRVSSTLRTEAAKLFWGDPNTYYLVGSDWLLTGAYPGYTHYEQSIFPYVQNIEIEHFHYTDDRIALPQSNGEFTIQYNAIRHFWITLRRKFPRVRKVIFNQNGCSMAYNKYNGIISYCFRMLIRPCPTDIDVSIDVLEYEIPVFENTVIPLPTSILKRSLYRPTQDGEWRKIAPSPDRITILMPSRMFHGPVGEFEQIRYIGARLCAQRCARGSLLIEAIDRHYFDKETPEPFSCPETGCDVYLQKAGQWTLHALRDHGLDMIASQWEPENLLAVLPNEMREKFRRHDKNIIGRLQQLDVEIKRMSDEWNEKGGKKKKDMESKFIDQLKYDEAWDTGTEARESTLWSHFTTAMRTASYL